MRFYLENEIDQDNALSQAQLALEKLCRSLSERSLHSSAGLVCFEMLLASLPVHLAFTSAPRSPSTVHGLHATRTAGVVATETRPKFVSGLLGKVLGTPNPTQP